MALDWVNDNDRFELLGGYFSPVSDDYKKPGLMNHMHRINMTRIAVSDSSWLMIDEWEARQPAYVRTVSVLEHFQRKLKGKIMDSQGNPVNAKIMLLAGGDLIQSFAVPNLWNPNDVCFA